jgi:hypothetical protein
VSLYFSAFIGLSILGAAFVIAAWVMVFQLIPENRQKESLRWLARWSIKGLALPIILWTLMNIGWSWSLQPFMPEVQFVKNNGGQWAGPFLKVTGYGIFIVCSYWTAVTLGWVLRQTSTTLQDQSRSDFKALCTTCGLGLALPALFIAWLGGWPLVGMAASVVLGPIAGYTPGILARKKTPPMYARAIARMKFGKYNEAELEIISELEKCEDDFDGWMMLAELYAKHFNDLSEAEQTVMELCDQPHTTPSQLSVALHRLSEWHLKLGDNPDAARRALQVICDRLPGTHLAHMAQLRINQLPGTTEELREMRNPRPIPLPGSHTEVNVVTTVPDKKVDKAEATKMANLCVEKLTQDPNDIPAREKLARLMAERLDQVDQALEQLTLLLNLPQAPAEKRAGWLSLMANWHINQRQDLDSGRKILERLIREFPNSVEAAFARRKIQSLDVEFHG